MENLKEKQICECGEMSVIQAQKIFKDTKLHQLFQNPT